MPLYIPKGLTALLVDVHLVLQWGRITLAQAVDIKNGDEVVQLIEAGEGHGLPHGAFRQLAISQQAIDAVAANRGGTLGAAPRPRALWAGSHVVVQSRHGNKLLGQRFRPLAKMLLGTPPCYVRGPPAQLGRQQVMAQLGPCIHVGDRMEPLAPWPLFCPSPDRHSQAGSGDHQMEDPSLYPSPFQREKENI